LAVQAGSAAQAVRPVRTKKEIHKYVRDSFASNGGSKNR